MTAPATVEVLVIVEAGRVFHSVSISTEQVVDVSTTVVVVPGRVVVCTIVCAGPAGAVYTFVIVWPGAVTVEVSSIVLVFETVW